MEAKKIVMAEILSNEPIAKDVMKMTLLAPEVASAARSGQFVNVYTDDSAMLLPRPISICDADDRILTLVYGIVGKGTQWFAGCCAGQQLRVSTPLGNGYDLSKVKTGCGQSALLIGGGIGVPPMVKLARELRAMDLSVMVVAGFKDESFLLGELVEIGLQFSRATDSGREGFHGTTLDLIRAGGFDGDHWFACGPKGMLKAVTAEALSRGKDIQVSMEERMGCGYGACVGCVVDVREKGAAAPVRKKVCKDGPVFWGSEVFFDER